MTISPQSTNIQPDSTLPSTPKIVFPFAFTDSTNLSDKDLACLFELAVAIIIASANDEIPSISRVKTFSALLSISVSLQMS
jgi:hypothetical protein